MRWAAVNPQLPPALFILDPLRHRLPLSVIRHTCQTRVLCNHFQRNRSIRMNNEKKPLIERLLPPPAPPNTIQTVLYESILGALGISLIAASSRVSLRVSGLFAPFTLQSLAVVSLGAIYGWQRGALCCAGYVFSGTVLKWPVFTPSESKTVTSFVESKSSGYLLGFPVAAAVVGKLVEQREDKISETEAKRDRIASLGPNWVAMMAGHVITLATGGLWLLRFTDLRSAVKGGVLPFLPGAAVKSAIGAGIVVALQSLTMRF